MPTKDEIYAAMASKIVARKRAPVTKKEPHLDEISRQIARLKAKRKPNEPMPDTETD